MANVSRVSVVWSGFAGAPGITKLSFQELADDTARNAAGAAVRAFFYSLQTYLPAGASLQVQPQVDDLDLVTGQLMHSASMTTTPPVVPSGSSAAPYTGGSGFCITWLAGGVFAGRRIQGRTFFVPAQGVYETDGTIQGGVITTVQSAAATLMAAPGCDLAIWTRQWTKTKPPEPIAGMLASATSCVVKDMASQLRSRRT